MREEMDKISKKAKEFAELLEDTAILDCTDGDGISQEKVVDIYNKIDSIRQNLTNFFAKNNAILVFDGEFDGKEENK